jgi:hypothetical protein
MCISPDTRSGMVNLPPLLAPSSCYLPFMGLNGKTAEGAAGEESILFSFHPEIRKMPLTLLPEFKYEDTKIINPSRLSFPHVLSGNPENSELWLDSR